jgi:hypothetical protein
VLNRVDGALKEETPLLQLCSYLLPCFGHFTMLCSIRVEAINCASKSLDLMVRELDPLTLTATGRSRSGWRSGWLCDSRCSMTRQVRQVLDSFIGSMWAQNGWSRRWRKKRQGDGRWRDILRNSASGLRC